MNKTVILSILDQGMMSAFNLALSFAFIAYATPAIFGSLVLIQAGAFFAISAQNALVVMPLNYLLPGREGPKADADISLLTSVNLLLTLAMSLASLGLSVFVQADVALFIAIGAYFATVLLREYVRNLSIVTGHMSRTLRDDAVMIFLSALAVPALWTIFRPETAALGGMALGNLGALIISRPNLRLDPGRIGAHLAAYRAIWKETRWALQGAMQNEVETRAYVFVVEHWRGAAALGTLQAGRIALSPLMLVINGWRRIARPRIVADLHRGRNDAVNRTLCYGAAAIAAATILYGLALVVAWPLLENFVFRQRYPDMGAIVLCWWLYSCVMAAAAVVVTLLEATRQFRVLARIGFGVALAIIVMLAGLTLIEVDIITVILSLTGIHLIEITIYCILIYRGAGSGAAKTDAATPPVTEAG